MTRAVILILLMVITGSGMAASGVFLLLGLGWALLVASVPLFGMAAVLARGLKRAE